VGDVPRAVMVARGAASSASGLGAFAEVGWDAAASASDALQAAGLMFLVLSAAGAARGVQY
jgi:hypothetical protein